VQATTADLGITGKMQRQPGDQDRHDRGDHECFGGRASIGIAQQPRCAVSDLVEHVAIMACDGQTGGQLTSGAFGASTFGTKATPPDVGHGHVPHVDPAHPDRPGIGVMQAHQQRQHGRLADDAQHLPRRQC